MLPNDAVLLLVLFVVLLLALSLHGLAASGHFPHEHRSPTLRSGAGRGILRGTIVIALAALVAGITAAWRVVP